MANVLNDIEASGTRWQVTVDHTGYFTARCDGYKPVSARMYSELPDKVRAMIADAKVKVDVPYSRFYDDEVIDGTATGLHSTTGKVLVRENGSAGQLSGYYNSEFRRPSAEDRAEMNRLHAVREAANTALKVLTSKYALPGGLTGAVKAAVTEARQVKADKQLTGAERREAGIDD